MVAARVDRGRSRVLLLAIGIVAALPVAAYAVLTYIPVQRAIYPADLGKYDNIIVIQYGLGAPTDYVMIGDSTGLFEKSSEKRVPVNLQGAVPPNGKPGIKYGNDFIRSHTRYICFVKYNGRQPVYDQGLIETYTVTDWAPLGPISRDWPAWIEPRGYTCLWDFLM
jgi:hypothetical protein